MTSVQRKLQLYRAGQEAMRLACWKQFNYLFNDRMDIMEDSIPIIKSYLKFSTYVPLAIELPKETRRAHRASGRTSRK